MNGNGKRWLVAATVLAFAALGIGVGMRLSAADEAKPVDLADLREAVQAASKRGDNVDEIARALDAFEKSVAKGFKQEAGKTDPPPELAALRSAVEAAARKGENVDDIRKQLNAVEKKLLGRVLEAPKAVAPPLGDPPPAIPEAPFRRFPRDFPVPPRLEFPDFPRPGFRGFDNEQLKKAQELQRKAIEMMLKNPNDAEAEKLMREALDLMLKGVGDGQGGILAPELFFGDLGGRAAAERFRLGIRMEKLSPITVEQLGLEAGRGVAIAEVIAGSPADKAGFKANDIVIEFAGKPVPDEPAELNKMVSELKAGKVDAVVLRKGKKVEIKGIDLPEAAQEFQRPNRRVPQPRFGVRPLPLPVPVPDAPGAELRESSMSVTINNGEFTIKAKQDGAQYNLQGTIADGTTTVREIAIEAGGKVNKYESLDKVPAEHKAAVEKFLKSIGGKPEIQLKPRRVKD